MKKAKPKNALRRFREGKGWTLAEMAERLGVSVSTCCRMEYRPTVPKLVTLALESVAVRCGR